MAGDEAKVLARSKIEEESHELRNLGGGSRKVKGVQVPYDNREL